MIVLNLVNAGLAFCGKDGLDSEVKKFREKVKKLEDFDSQD